MNRWVNFLVSLLVLVTFLVAIPVIAGEKNIDPLGYTEEKIFIVTTDWNRILENGFGYPQALPQEECYGATECYWIPVNGYWYLGVKVSRTNSSPWSCMLIQKEPLPQAQGKWLDITGTYPVGDQPNQCSGGLDKIERVNGFATYGHCILAKKSVLSNEVPEIGLTPDWWACYLNYVLMIAKKATFEMMN